jgi:hypothetical protein
MQETAKNRKKMQKTEALQEMAKMRVFRTQNETSGS